MTKIPSDDILDSLYKLRIRESDQLKTALELYDMEIHQKISMPNYQKLKMMAKRSIDQKLRLRNFNARFTRAALRQGNIREKEGPSLGEIQVKIPHQRSPYALKCEDRSPRETARQGRCARGDAWELAKFFL